jgi:hypothetical protein
LVIGYELKDFDRGQNWGRCYKLNKKPESGKRAYFYVVELFRGLKRVTFQQPREIFGIC